MSRLSGYHDWCKLCLDKWADVVDKLIAHAASVRLNPFNRDLFLDVGNLVYIVEVCCADVRVFGDSL